MKHLVFASWLALAAVGLPSDWAGQPSAPAPQVPQTDPGLRSKSPPPRGRSCVETCVEEGTAAEDCEMECTWVA